MALNGLPFGHSVAFGDGVADTVANVVAGMKSGDNILAVISWPDAGTSVRGDDADDFTAGNGTMTGATVSLTGRQFMVVFTSAPSS